MLKCAGVFTYEVDDGEVALADIQSQLDKQITLLDHTVGIVLCHTEFVGSGTLKYVCDHLPFDVVGVTNASQAVNGEAGEMILTIFVMTSDDVEFRACVTNSLEDEIDGPTRAACQSAAAGMDGLPQLALAFPPLILKYAGDAYVAAWSEILPNVPVFGTLAIDDTVSFSDSETIFNGDTSKTNMAFVLCYGNIQPRFVVGALSESATMPYKGEITRSDGPFVSEINNTNAYKYFEDLGFARDGVPADNFLFMPFVIDQQKRVDYDGVPVMRVLASFTDDGTAIFRGNVDQNSVFTLLSTKPEHVLASTQEKLAEIKAMQDVNGVLLFSCIIRRMMVMGIDALAELEGANGELGSGVPFMMGYSGGEICPTSIRNGVATNRFHNYTLIAMVI